jgi:serralysin
MTTISETDANTQAGFMVDDFWNAGSLAFDVGPGDTLYIDILALNAQGQLLAKAALDVWSAYTGINFVYGNYDASVWSGNTLVSTGTQNAIIFDDNQLGASAGPNLYFGGNTGTGADNTIWNSGVNVSTSWLTSNGVSVDSYSFQTYLHEIGHAMGLGHAGPYDGSATYGVDNNFAFDSWQMTVMSYFDQNENTDPGTVADFAWIISPMMADIVAMQTLYGTAGNLRTGNNTYGSEASLAQFGADFAALLGYDAPTGPMSATIIDDGGIDTFDFSSDDEDQEINLASGGVSTVYGVVGNIIIFFGTVIENVLAGSGNDTVYGNGVANNLNGGLGSDDIFGYGGNDTLIGGGGIDTLTGGMGSDFYVIHNAADKVVENAGEGTDKVFALTSYSLNAQGQHIENLTLVGSNNVNGTGNSLNNTLRGNSGHNILDGGLGGDFMVGGDGNDTYYVDSAFDSIQENLAQGNDRVMSSISFSLAANSHNLENLTLTGSGNTVATGNGLNNTLRGNTGHNTLNGGLGGDAMFGGDGNDSYIVDNVFDTVGENANEGIDRVFSSVSFSLASHSAHLENLTLVGSGNINGTGNAGNNTVRGNSGNNILNGGAGGDFMAGGLGNDTYYVDNSFDSIQEHLAQGTDRVISTVSFSLASHSHHLENLTLAGSGNINGTGNGLNNTIHGNDGHNVLNGGLGGDYMAGGDGNDTYIVDNTFDSIVENASEGTDRVYSTVTYSLASQGEHIENLTLVGSANVNATGNDIGNQLRGNSGNNTLTGLDGADAFIFVGSFGDDIITDFDITQLGEKIDISLIGSITDYTDLLNNHMVQSGNNVVIADGNGNSITLLDIEILDLNAGDFIF